MRRAPAATANAPPIESRAFTVDPPNLEQFGKPVAHSIPTIIRSYKSAVTKRINELRPAPSTPVWQRNYYEHIITTDREYVSIVEYIYANPRAWLTDTEAPQTARYFINLIRLTPLTAML